MHGRGEPPGVTAVTLTPTLQGWAPPFKGQGLAEGAKGGVRGKGILKGVQLHGQSRSLKARVSEIQINANSVTCCMRHMTQ